MRWLVVVAVLGGVAHGAAIEEHHYAITIPDGWERIDASAIERIVASDDAAPDSGTDETTRSVALFGDPTSGGRVLVIELDGGYFSITALENLGGLASGAATSGMQHTQRSWDVGLVRSTTSVDDDRVHMVATLWFDPGFVRRGVIAMCYGPVRSDACVKSVETLAAGEPRLVADQQMKVENDTFTLTVPAGYVQHELDDTPFRSAFGEGAIMPARAVAYQHPNGSRLEILTLAVRKRTNHMLGGNWVMSKQVHGHQSWGGGFGPKTISNLFDGEYAGRAVWGISEEVQPDDPNEPARGLIAFCARADLGCRFALEQLELRVKPSVQDSGNAGGGTSVRWLAAIVATALAAFVALRVRRAR